MNYYKVQAKCGHVGKNWFILKWFYVIADSGPEASKIVRFTPRVKHDHKFAIKEVVLITQEEYMFGKRSNDQDEYFKIHNSQQQKFYNEANKELILPEEKPVMYKKKHNGQRLKNEYLAKETKRLIQGGKYYDE